jgi:flagellar biosynthesis protein FlhF
MTQAQSTLHMKTYFATTVEAAVELARRELGSDALLVNSRPAPEDVRHLGRYEVIFATGAPEAELKRQPRVVEPYFPQKAAARKPAAPPSGTDTHLQLEDIRLQLTTIRQTLWSSRSDADASPSDASMMRRVLEGNGVDSGLARELVHAVVRQSPTPANRDQFREALAAEMGRRLEVDPDLQTRSTVALVGPPGRGKSTTLVKLAIAQGLARRSSVRILSMDNFRVGASEQMRHACESIAELDRQLGDTWGADMSRPTLTLIDTSGYGPADLDDAADLAAYFSAHPEISVHLVLRADGKAADSIYAVQRYSHFGVSHLIFTGMDEAATVGSVYSAAVQTAIPVSYLGNGQRIPEDLEPAAKARLVQLVLEGKEAAVSAAA